MKFCTCIVCQGEIEILESDIVYRYYPSHEDNSKHVILCDSCCEWLYDSCPGYPERTVSEE